MKFKNTGVIAVFVLLLIFGFVLFGKSDQNQKKESLPPDIFKTENPIQQPADIAALTNEETVVDFVRQNNRLPDYYTTKDQARKLGWKPETGNLCDVLPGRAIGGDRFGNRENKLPKNKSRKYFEADLNYNCGRRGTDRLIYSSDGLIFITKDHYKTFQKKITNMENEVTFDFDQISDYDEFYSMLKLKFDLPEWFGDNLDALYDFISGDLKLPCHLKLINLSLEQIEDFEDLFEILEDAENEINGFSFSYYMEQFDNFEEDEYSD